MKIELSHDILARKVYEKASSEDKLVLKIEQLIKQNHERYLDREVLLGKEDLEYIAPFLDRTNITKEESAFIEKSRAAVASKAALRNRLIFGAILVLAILTGLSVWQAIEAGKSEQKAKTASIKALKEAQNARKAEAEALSLNKELSLATKEARIAETEARNQASLAREAQAVAEQKTEEAKRNLEIAKRNAEEAERQRLLADSANADLLRKENRLTKQNETLEAQTEEIKLRVKQTQEANKNVQGLFQLAQAKTLSNRAVRLIQGGKIEEGAKLSLEAHETINKFLNIEVETNRDSTKFLKDQLKIQDVDDYNSLYSTLTSLNLANHRVIDVFYAHREAVRSLSINPTNGIVASGDDLGEVIVWDPSNRNKIVDVARIKTGINRRVRTVAFDAKGQNLYVGTMDGRLIEWKIEGNKLKNYSTLSYQYDPIIAIASPKEKDRYLLFASDSTFCLYDREDKRTYINSGFGKINTIAVSPSGSFAFLGTSKGLYYIQLNYQELNKKSFIDGKNSRLIEFNFNEITALQISPDRRHLAIGNKNGTVWIKRLTDILDNKINTEDGETEHRSMVTSLSYSKKGDQLLSTSLDRTADIWNVFNLNEERVSLKGHNGWVWGGYFWEFGNTTLIFTISEDRSIRRWYSKANDIAEMIEVQLDYYIRGKERIPD